MKADGRKNRIPTSGGSEPLAANPFGSLDLAGLPEGVKPPEAQPSRRAKPERAPGWRGRVDVRRESAGRGGKTVTVIKGFQKISKPEIEDLLRQLQKATASGGTLKEGRIELQGDRSEAVMRILSDHGFRPVRSGG